jgi:hypothetical protein
MSQYTVEIDYEVWKSKLGIELNKIKPIFELLTQNLVDELNSVGWNAHRDDNEYNSRIRFWLNENAVKKIVDEEISKNKPKFRGIFIGLVGTIFGEEGKKKFFVLEKEVVNKAVKENFMHNIEKQLLAFKGSPGVSVMKGSKNLFEELIEQKDTKKFKLN